MKQSNENIKLLHDAGKPDSNVLSRVVVFTQLNSIPHRLNRSLSSPASVIWAQRTLLFGRVCVGSGGFENEPSAA